jgi:uncharacterized protein
MNLKVVELIAGALVVIGALNWGLVGTMKFDLVAFIFGATVLSSIVYILVGAAGIFLLARWMSSGRRHAIA